jgi:hypothetical protein
MSGGGGGPTTVIIIIIVVTTTETCLSEPPSEGDIIGHWQVLRCTQSLEQHVHDGNKTR